MKFPFFFRKKKSPPPAPKAKASPMPEPFRVYTLEDIHRLNAAPSAPGVGSYTVFHDISMGKWRVTYQLDPQRVWFLSVFLSEDGEQLAFSLDEELANDSHYEFQEERALRQTLYQPGDEDRYLHEILLRHAQDQGAGRLYALLRPYITAEYHF